MGGTNGSLGVVYKLSYPVPADDPNEPNITGNSNDNGNL